VLIFLDELSTQQDLQFKSVFQFPEVFRCFRISGEVKFQSTLDGWKKNYIDTTFVEHTTFVGLTHPRTSFVSYFGFKTILG